MNPANRPGNGPPKGVEASALFLKLAARERPLARVEFPHSPKEDSLGEVGIWVLRENELQACRANGDKFARAQLADAEARTVGGLGYEELYRNEVVVQILTLAVRDAGDPQFPIFVKPEQTRSLETDIIAVLVESYNEHRRESGPILSEMTSDEMNAWIRLLREGASRVPLARVSSEAKSDLIMHLVSLLPTSSTDNGLPGSPPDTSTTT